LLAFFYGSQEYAGAMVREHGTYVRSGSSFLCTHHLGASLLHDPAFHEPMQLYQHWYTDYFRIFCDGILAETEQERGDIAALESLKPFLKEQLAQARRAILAMAPDPRLSWREIELRKPTGDTQKLRTLFTNIRIAEARAIRRSHRS